MRLEYIAGGAKLRLKAVIDNLFHLFAPGLNDAFIHAVPSKMIQFFRHFAHHLFGLRVTGQVSQVERNGTALAPATIESDGNG